MIENFRRSVERKSLAPEKADDTATLNHGEELLSAIEDVNRGLDKDVAERFGRRFYDKACARINAWYEQSFQKGEDMVNWAELRGLQLPKSKVGMRALSGVTGITGMVIPFGLVSFLPLSFVLWKRSSKINASNVSKNAEI